MNLPLDGGHVAGCVDDVIAPAPVFVLGGWGMRVELLAPLARALGAETLQLPALETGAADDQRRQLRTWLRARLPARSVLIGWSMGGSIAVDFAAEHPERVAALVTIASNPCFCSRSGWVHGVAPEQFADFRAGLTRDAAAQLVRFAALQARGDRLERQVLRQLRAGLDAPDDRACLQSRLSLLLDSDLRESLRRVEAPSLHVLGTADSLVPVALADELSRFQPAASVWKVEGAAHAPFLSRPAAVAARIGDFLESLRPQQGRRSRREVARSFSRAARSYDANARVQAISALRLLDCCPSGLAARRGLDLGCGTGLRLDMLRERVPDADWIAADIAEGMLGVLRERDSASLPVAVDAEFLPFAEASFDIVYSNLAMQWLEDPSGLFAEIARVLRPGGVALLGTLGPDTLWELRAAWRLVDREVHAHRFESLQRLREAAQSAGLYVALREVDWHIERHADVFSVAHALHDIGARNLDPQRPRTLTGRRRWRELAQAYASICGDGPGLELSWQLLRLVLRKTHD